MWCRYSTCTVQVRLNVWYGIYRCGRGAVGGAAQVRYVLQRALVGVSTQHALHSLGLVPS